MAGPNPAYNTMDFPFSSSQSSYITTSDAKWISIAHRKRAARDALIPSKWRVPSSVMPKDPPQLSQGPQSVLHVPRKLLSPAETEITEGYTVATLLEAIRRQKHTAAEVTDAFCHRAANAQQLTNCITEPLFAQAAERAKFLDKYLKDTGKVFGPLHGLPLSIKDTFNYKGVDSSTGIASLCFKPVESNAALVNLLLGLGAVIVCKTNVPQTMASLDSVNNVFGRTMNPTVRWACPGGSSGGEGVIVAMRGSMVGFGTDIGGSIRVPAYVNGVVGFKPSEGRIPYYGQRSLGVEGMSRCGISAVAGPLAHSVADINYVLNEVIPCAHLYGSDALPAAWSTPSSPTPIRGSGPQSELVIGILRSDNNCTLLPPISNVLNEVSSLLSHHPNIRIIDLPTPKAWTKSQSAMSKLMGVEGGERLASLIAETDEPMVPWMSTRTRTGKPRNLVDVAAIQAQRSQLEEEMSRVWFAEDEHGRRTRRVDAIICPLAAHPVPEIERYNAVGYTSSFVFFDYPAGSIPVREVVERDLELGKALGGKVLGSWDEKCRELWDEKVTDRRCYLGTPLSVQVVTARLEDEKLAGVMALVEGVVRGTDGKGRAKL